jgi:hypothetical protein
MSIRWIAQELYRLQREAVALEKQIRESPVEEGEKLRLRLLKVQAERDHARRVLDGKKDTELSRKF